MKGKELNIIDQKNLRVISTNSPGKQWAQLKGIYS